MTSSTYLEKPARILLAGAVFAASLTLPSGAHDVITTPLTFSREISRIIHSRCAACHRPGGRAFSLLTYQDARPWATAIKEETLERRMPPWGAVNGFGDFSGDQALTQEQIGMIAEWVEGGAPEGDPALLPKPSGILGDSHGKGAGLENSGPAPPTTEILVNDVLALKAPLTVAGIRPKQIPGGASVMVVAERPDGSIEPLLWLYNFQARFARAYFYRAALRFVPGTRIKVSPPGAGTVALLAARRK